MGSWEFMILVFPRVNVSITKRKTSSKNNNPAMTGYGGSAGDEHREPGAACRTQQTPRASDSQGRAFSLSGAASKSHLPGHLGTSPLRASGSSAKMTIHWPCPSSNRHSLTHCWQLVHGASVANRASAGSSQSLCSGSNFPNTASPRKPASQRGLPKFQGRLLRRCPVQLFHTRLPAA